MQHRDDEEEDDVLIHSDSTADEEDIRESRTVYLIGDVEESRIKRVIRRIISLAESGRMDEPIHLYLSTFGGEVEEAFALYDIIKMVPCPVHTYAFGKVMSAGCLILASGEPMKRSIAPNAVLMYHAGWTEVIGNVWEMKAMLEHFAWQEKRYDELLAAECGRTLAEVEALYSLERVNRYLSAEEVVSFGFADRIIPVTPPRKPKLAR